MVDVEVVETPELGDRSYVAHDGRPPSSSTRSVTSTASRVCSRPSVALRLRRRDPRPQRLCLRRARARQAHGRDLPPRRRRERSRFERRAVSDGDEFAAGKLRVRVVATPGHTFDHVAYVVDDGARPSRSPGGSLLFGSVGRTDLLGAEHTETLARLQFRSARRLGELLADDVPVYPTHGFGSFCSSGNVAAAPGQHDRRRACPQRRLRAR